MDWKSLSRSPTFFLLLSVILAFFCGVLAWNYGPVGLDDLNLDYSGGFSFVGKPEFQRLNSQGILKVRAMLTSRTHPSLSPVNILFQHFWYNCFTSGYDLVVRLDPNRSSGSHYTLYHHGKNLFLRIEYSGYNRVLRTGFTPAEFATLLASYTIPEDAEQVPGR